MFEGKRKPSLKYVLEIAKIKETYVLSGTDSCTLTITKVICDLPALAHVCNINQYNGKYGCPLCLIPGEYISNGAGNSRVYIHKNDDYDNVLRTVDKNDQLANLAVNERKAVMGIKGHSPLRAYTLLPSSIDIDEMHMLFEGVTKMLFNAMLDSKNSGCEFYLGRPKNN